MEKKLLEIRDFVQSLENSELSKKQEAVLLVGESENCGLGSNYVDCTKSFNEGNCYNYKCPGSTNNRGCINIDCSNANDNTSCTGGGSGTGGSGTNGIPGGTMGFPGFDL